MVQRSEAVSSLKELHLQILNGEHEFKKEELFLCLLEELMHDHSNLSFFRQLLTRLMKSKQSAAIWKTTIQTRSRWMN